MPRYFFNIHDAVADIDHEGTDLPDIATAQLETSRLAAGILADHPGVLWQGQDRSIEVTDENGLILFVLHLAGILAPAISR